MRSLLKRRRGSTGTKAKAKAKAKAKSSGSPRRSIKAYPLERAGGLALLEFLKDSGLASTTTSTAEQSGWISAEEKESASIIPQARAGGLGWGEIIPPPYDLEALSKLLDVSPEHYACVMIKASALASGGWRIVPAEGRGEPESEPEPELEPEPEPRSKLKPRLEPGSRRDRELKPTPHPPKELLEFFKNCNPELGFIEVVFRVGVDYEATGNGWLEIVRNPLGRVMELHPLPAAYMRVLDPKFQKKTGLYAVQQYKGEKAYFRAALHPEDLEGGYQALNYRGEPVTEVIHWKNYCPVSYYYGTPDIISALPSLVGNKLARLHGLDFFEEKGIPPYVLFIMGADFIDEEEKSTAQRFFTEQLKQHHARLLIMTFPAGAEEVRLERLAEDISPDIYGNYITANIDDIARVHRVPPKLLAVREPRTLGGVAESAAQLEQFNALVMRPLRGLFEERLTKFIIQAGGWKQNYAGWELRFNEVNLRSLKDLAAIYADLTRMGFLSVNDVRLELGRPPWDLREANAPFVMMGGQPIALSDIFSISDSDSSDSDSDSGSKPEQRRAQLQPEAIAEELGVQQSTIRRILDEARALGGFAGAFTLEELEVMDQNPEAISAIVQRKAEEWRAYRALHSDGNDR